MSQPKRKYEEDHEEDHEEDQEGDHEKDRKKNFKEYREKYHEKRDTEFDWSLFGEEFKSFLCSPRPTGSAVSEDVRSKETPYSFSEALEEYSKWLKQKNSTISKDFAPEGNSISYRGSIEEHGSTISKDVALERTSGSSQNSIGKHAHPDTQQNRPSGPRTADSLDLTTPRYVAGIDLFTYMSRYQAYDVAERNIVSHGSTEERASPYTQQNQRLGPYAHLALSSTPIRNTYYGSRPRDIQNRPGRTTPTGNAHDGGRLSNEFSLSPFRQPGTSAPQTTYKECVACRETIERSQTVRFRCSHEYCHGCLAELFKAATTSLFPPSCCNLRIPIDSYEAYLPPALVAKVKAKEAEHRDPNRTFCHTCSACIPPEDIEGNTATCPACTARTCVSCKGKAHLDACPEDRGSQEVLRIASKKGWKQCPRCSSIVELSYGCEHMTCLCGEQFCYTCGRTWRKCKCAPNLENFRLHGRNNRALEPRELREELHRLDEAGHRRLDEQLRGEIDMPGLQEEHATPQQRHNGRCADDEHAWDRIYLRGTSYTCDSCEGDIGRTDDGTTARSPTSPLSYIYECINCHMIECQECGEMDSEAELSLST